MICAIDGWTKLESWHCDEDKARWKLVRTDDCTDIPGKIVIADADTGECVMEINGESRTLNLGPRGFKIVPVARGAF